MTLTDKMCRKMLQSSRALVSSLRASTYLDSEARKTVTWAPGKSALSKIRPMGRSNFACYSNFVRLIVVRILEAEQGKHCFFHRAAGVYCARDFNFSLQGEAIMSLRAVEEVSTQVPADDFQALEDKVYRTIELYKSAREARNIAERDVQRLREQLEEREEEVESMRREMVSLRKEREEIRGRVEKMLAQIDRMAEEPAAS